jgi:hypothetical protein
VSAKTRIRVLSAATLPAAFASALLVLATLLPGEASKRDPAADPVTVCFFRPPDVQNIRIYKSLQVANGVVTCTYDAGQFDRDTPLSAESAVSVFINLYENYPNATKYVCLIPRGEFMRESFRLVTFKSAMHAAFVGKGESGNAHYNEDAIMSHIREYVDGLPVSDGHYP